MYVFTSKAELETAVDAWMTDQSAAMATCVRAAARQQSPHARADARALS